jgi:hypothetical protein
MTSSPARTTRVEPFWCAVWVAGILMALALGQPALAQGSPSAPRGSRLIATTDWMTETVSRVRERGYLGALSPLSQPWERNEVARALSAIPVAAFDTMPRHVAGWLRLLRSELAMELARLEGRQTAPVGFMAWGGATMGTSPRVDPYFPLRKGVAPFDSLPRNKQNVWPFFGGSGWAERGALAAELRIGTDIALRRADPDGNWPRRLFDVLPDNEVSYLSGRFADGGFVVGRLRRNWAPIGSKGLMVSDAAFGLPQIGYDFGGRNLVVRGFVSELDTISGRERYFVAHRIEYLRDNFAISLGESKVYGSKGGARLVNFNPIEIFFITGDYLGGEEWTNTTLDGQFWLRRGRMTFSGETLVDDAWVTLRAPLRAALSASTRYLGPGWFDVGLDYRVVLSFTYWSPTHHERVDRFLYHGRGLGDNFTDYDRWTLFGSIYPGVSGLRLTPTVALQRKGEWDLRQPGIANDVWLTQKSFLQGIAESMTRFAIAGRYQPSRDAFFEWDAGLNLVRNADHVAGRSLSEFSAMARFGLLWSRPGLGTP